MSATVYDETLLQLVDFIRHDWSAEAGWQPQPPTTEDGWFSFVSALETKLFSAEAHERFQLHRLTDAERATIAAQATNVYLNHCGDQ